MSDCSNDASPEKMYQIKTIPSCPSKILQSYQADEIFEINATGKFLVKTKDKEFSITIYPLLQSDFLVDELLGMANRFFSLTVSHYRILEFYKL